MATTQKSKTRTQVITPRSSRRIAKPRSRHMYAIGKRLQSVAAMAKPAAILIAIVLLIVAYNAVARSSLFSLNRVDINVDSSDLQADVEKAVRNAVGKTSVLNLDLEAVREKIESLTRVRAASVARVLPDALSVRVVEREPAVLARRKSNALAWLDLDGVEIGDTLDLRSEFSDRSENQPIPPIATGFSEGDRSQGDIAEDRERIGIYRRIEEEFRKEPNPLWNLLDEIDLTFTKHVKLQLANSPVMVHVGDEDFRNRFQTAIQVISAIRQGDSELLNRYRIQDPERLIQNADNISFIDVARSDRIVLNFSTPGKEKAVKQEQKRSGK